MIDGPSPSTSSCCRAHRGQAPEIDAVVYLTDCDPAAYRARASSSVPKSSTPRDYDLVAAPVTAPLTAG